MEKLSLLQNQVTKNKEFFIKTQDLQQAGISPTVLFPHVNPLGNGFCRADMSSPVCICFLRSSLWPSWLPCQVPGIIGSVLGMVGLVSVYCDWVRQEV